MKKTIFALLALPLLVSCSDIPENERYVEVESVAPARTVLIEDFTGQNCVNCPAAHRTLDKLAEQYGDKLIAVSIHAGEFGVSSDYTRYTGLMQPEGNIYNDRYGITSWPQGVVNHGTPSTPDAWAETVRQEITKESPLDIAVAATLSADGTAIEITTELRPHADIDGTLQLWITENNIVTMQRDIDLGRINDYVHNHVFRACVNGTDGDAVNLKANIHTIATNSIALRQTPTETWVVGNLEVVAFVYDKTGVLQAAKCHVAQDNQETQN